jgi:cell division septum initiation protein DivIVA
MQLTALTRGQSRVMQRVDSLLEAVRHGADAKARISAAHQLAAMLEEGEEAFKLAVGNAPARTAQRPHHPIGKLLAAVRRDEGEVLGTALQVRRSRMLRVRRRSAAPCMHT